MKTVLFLLALAGMLASCINLHVHFPEAPSAQANPADAPQPAGQAK